MIVNVWFVPKITPGLLASSQEYVEKPLPAIKSKLAPQITSVLSKVQPAVSTKKLEVPTTPKLQPSTPAKLSSPLTGGVPPLSPS